MQFGRILGLAVLTVGMVKFSTGGAQAAACGYSWAEPGTYKITGNFRGKVESAGASLTRDCRISLKIPGVYTGGPVKRSGKCLAFTFKIEEVKGLHRGRWCDDYAIVTWKGKDVHAKIRKVRQGAK